MGTRRRLIRLLALSFVVALCLPLSAATAGQPPRVRVGGAIQPPKKIKDVKPVYPEDAKSAGVQGVVVLEIVIGTNGTVIETQVVRSVPLLDKAAADAVALWEYTPTLLNGEPAEVVMNVTINFTLSN